MIRAPHDAADPAARRESAIEKTRQLLESIAGLASSEKAASYLRDSEEDVRRAAVARLGALGDDVAVAKLAKAFAGEPRQVGIDASIGLGWDILAALAASRSPKARDEIRRIIESWVAEGPRWKGPYAHLYDSQYQNVMRLAMEALEAYPDPGTLEFLRSLNANASLFHGLREQAWRSALAGEMKAMKLAGPDARVAFLLGRLDPEGALIEDWWEEAGKKRPAAIRESAVESLLAGLGGAAAPGVMKFLAGTPPGEHAVRTAAASVLSTILGRGDQDVPGPLAPAERKAIVEAVLAYLEEMPAGKTSSLTTERIYDEIYASAGVLDDRGVWERLKRIAPKIARPDDWKGPAPGARELGVPLPEGAVFIESFSTAVETPLGRLTMARFFVDQEADQVLTWFEKRTGKKSRPAASLSLDHPDEKCRLFETGKTPPELAGFIDLGVTVCSDSAGYAEKAFGETLRKGKSLLKVNRLASR